MTTREEYQARREAWVEALRSGKYQQAQGMLRDNGAYCCLGVVCELSKLGKWDDDRYVVGKWRLNGELETPVREWIGLYCDAGTYDPAEANASLAEQNDTGATFSEIADLIEQRASDLFIPEAL